MTYCVPHSVSHCPWSYTGPCMYYVHSVHTVAVFDLTYKVAAGVKRDTRLNPHIKKANIKLTRVLGEIPTGYNIVLRE